MNNEGKWARERDEERRRRVKARRQRAIRIQSTEQGRRRIGPGRIPAVCVADKRGQLVLNTRAADLTVRGTGRGCLCEQPAVLTRSPG